MDEILPSRFLIDFIAIVGVNKNLIPIKDKQSKLTYLQIVVGKFSNQIDSKYIELCKQNQVWLHLIFNQKYKPGITYIQFVETKPIKQNTYVYSHYQEFQQGKIPVLINSLDQFYKHSQQHFNNSILYHGNYNLNPYLNIQHNKDYVQLFNQILVYKVDGNQSICDIQIIDKSCIDQKQVWTLPSDFKPISSKCLNNKIMIYRKSTFRSLVTSPLKLTYKPELIDRFPLDQRENKFPSQFQYVCFPQGVHLLQQIKLPQSYSLILTNSAGVRFYSSILVFSEQYQNQMYIQKAICTISAYNYSFEFVQLLKNLYRLQLSQGNISLENIIKRLCTIYMIPFKDWGKVGLIYEYGRPQIKFNTCQKFPIVSVYQFNKNQAVKTIFYALSLSNIEKICSAILLEKKIFFISKSKVLLSLVIEGFILLIYPFVWQNILISILPINSRKLIHAPFPYIIGFTESIQEEITQEMTNQMKHKCVKIFLDQNQIINGESFPTIFLKRLEKLGYDKYYQIERFNLYLLKISNAFSTQAQFSEEQNQIDVFEIRDAFLEMNTSLMKKYVQCIDRKGFNLQKFLNENNANKAGSFIQKFTQTSMFQSFINLKKTSYIQYFDQCLNAKRTKKNPFLIYPLEMQKYLNIKMPSQQKQKKFIYKKFPSFHLDRENHYKNNIMAEECINTLYSQMWMYKGYWYIKQNYFPKGFTKAVISTFKQSIQYKLTQILFELFPTQKTMNNFLSQNLKSERLEQLFKEKLKEKSRVFFKLTQQFKIKTYPIQIVNIMEIQSFEKKQTIAIQETYVVLINQSMIKFNDNHKYVISMRLSKEPNKEEICLTLDSRNPILEHQTIQLWKNMNSLTIIVLYLTSAYKTSQKIKWHFQQIKYMLQWAQKNLN